MAKERFAAIDIGTLRVKMLLAEIDSEGHLTPLYETSTLTDLGKKPERGSSINREGFAKTAEELLQCRDTLNYYEVRNVRIVSTHALRQIKEGQYIAYKLSQISGFNIETVSQEEEAKLFYLAVIKDFEVDNDFAIVDVGGGSVQLLIGNKDRLKEVYLLKSGPVYLHDNFSSGYSKDQFPTQEEISSMEKHIFNQLSQVPRNLKIPIIYGSSSIIDLFKNIGLELRNYNGSDTHPFKTNLKNIKKIFEKIVQVPYQKREEMFNHSQKNYMYGIDKAFLNIICIGEHISATYVIPSNASINQGILLSMIKNSPSTY